MTTETESIYRECDGREVIKQIGVMNLLTISGGRAEIRPTGVTLKVGHGYSVEVDLNSMDLYNVKRVWTRGDKRVVKGEQTDVYFTEVGEVAYRASCYVNVEFGE